MKHKILRGSIESVESKLNNLQEYFNIKISYALSINDELIVFIEILDI